MKFVTPLMVKRFRAFRRIRRAWWSLIGLGVIALFCAVTMVLTWDTPYRVVDTKELEAYRVPETETVYDIRNARYNVAADGSIYGFEGPEEIRAKVLAGDPANPRLSGFAASVTPREGHTRVFLTSEEPPKAVVRELGLGEISFPFRPCWKHPFGIDAGGRDVFARVVHGTGIALAFGLVLAFSGMLIGLVVGAVEGYFGGKTDIACQRFTEIWSAIPFLYVMIFIGSTVGRSFPILLACYAVFNWIGMSYYMRAEFLRLRSRTFVEAAKCQGFSATRIIFGHILPNALTPMITLFPFLLMGAIGSLAALDFLGFGLPAMTPSCGELMSQAQQFRWAWWLILFPALMLFTVMLLTVFVGEGLRDAFDPRQKSKLE